MSIQSADWAQAEFGQVQLGDLRRVKRLVQLATQRAARPNASIPQSCGSKAATKAAYRFYENDGVPCQEILVGHIKVTQERLAREKIALAVQDSTTLDYTHHPATTGLGVLNDASHHGLLLHTTLAVTAQRAPLGIIDQQVWTRPVEELGKRHQRKTRPIDEKESQKWLSSLTATAGLQKQLPETRLVSVGDREADIYELCLLSESLRQDLLVRASWDRRVAHPEGHLWAHMESQPRAGTLTITVPRRGNQPARPASLAVRYGEVTLRPPRHGLARKLKTVTLWAVLIEEEAVPVGAEGVSWLLLTTVPTRTFAEACERVEWYTCRWVIEMYHKVLKSGCRIEERQFADVDEIKRYLPLDSIVAWRVLYLTMIGRQSPEMPCTVLFEAQEWQALYCFTHKTSTPPAAPPTLGRATLWIAQLGGYVGRQDKEPPGTIVMWRGIQRLSDLAAAWQCFRVAQPP